MESRPAATSCTRFLDDVEDHLEDLAAQAAAVDQLKKKSSLLREICHGLSYDVASETGVRLMRWLWRCYQCGYHDGISRSSASHASIVYSFALQLVPVLVWHYLDSVTTSTSQVKAHTEACLLAVYNKVVEDQQSGSSRPGLLLPSLSQLSIYHEPYHSRSSTTTLTLTESALSRHDTSIAAKVVRHPLVATNRITAANRHNVLQAVLEHFRAELSNSLPATRLLICHVCTSLCMSGMGSSPANLQQLLRPTITFSSATGTLTASRSNVVLQRLLSNSTVEGKVPSADNPLTEEELVKVLTSHQLPLDAAVLQEMIAAIHFCLFNGHQDAGGQALAALHLRAKSCLMQEVLLVTQALIHSFRGPCGSPEDGFLGLAAHTVSSLPPVLQKQPSTADSEVKGARLEVPISLQVSSPQGTEMRLLGDMDGANAANSGSVLKNPKALSPDDVEIEMTAAFEAPLLPNQSKQSSQMKKNQETYV